MCGEGTDAQISGNQGLGNVSKYLQFELQKPIDFHLKYELLNFYMTPESLASI